VKLRKGLGLLAPAVVIAMAAAACGGSSSTGGGGGGGGSSDQVKNGGVLKYGADQEPTGFNVNTSSDNGTAAQNVVIRVLPQTFFIHPDFTIQYDKELLSEEPKTETVNGKQVVTFKVKPEAVWSDGTPINSDDFEYLWKSITGKGFDVASTTGFDQIESVTGQGSDKKTVLVTFSKPFADWQSLFTNILPAHYMKAQESKFGGAKGAWEKAIKETLPISGGPWLIKSFDKTSKVVTLVRNDKYWGTKPHLDSIVYQILSDSSQQPAALKNNEVDLIYPQPQLDLVAQVRKLEPDVKSEVNFGLSFEHLDMNTQNQFLKDLKVRQAIAYAIDRQAIVKAGPAQFDSKASVLNNRIWLSNQKEYKDNGGVYATRNVDKAKSLLQEAGFSPGADGVMAKGGQKLSVRFSTTAGNKLRENTGVLVKSQLKEAGIDVKIDNVPSQTLFGERLPGGNFDLALFAWVGSPYAASGNFAIYHSATAANRQSNYGLLSDKRIDTAFEQVVQELDRQKVVDTLNQIDAYAWEDMVTIPLYQKPTFIGWRSTFGGIADNASQQGPFWNGEGFFKKQ
jgi:peptide/nickel transport system substrate-binding protein